MNKYGMAWIAVWSKLSIAIFMMFFLVFLLALNTGKAVKENPDPKATYLITLEWDPKSDDDVDLWVRDPGQHTVSFRNKEVGWMHLDRDDTGRAVDTFQMPDGTFKVLDISREVVTLRGVVPGWYIVNSHMFAKHDKGPQHIVAELVQIDPYKIVVHKEWVLEKRGQEHTMFQFHVTDNLDIDDINDLQQKLFDGEDSGYSFDFSHPPAR